MKKRDPDSSFDELVERIADFGALDDEAALESGDRRIDENLRVLSQIARVSGRSTADPTPGRKRLPDPIGPYEPVELLGEGGMGRVWLARQTEPVRRLVALKVIRAGMDSERVVARFEAERQTLALLDHPNVARVFDAGLTPTGLPYFVMEYVRGIPITDHCDLQQMTTRDRLRLFLDVCDAIQHAHSRGVIHRDIKPSNVLVQLEDGRSRPTVIDFGVARATTEDLTARPHLTEAGQLLGTPEYMSPEQASMGAIPVGPSTDVYSLGVLLYELLTGELPFEPGELRGQGPAGIQQTLREKEAPTPSSKASTADRAAENAADRGTSAPVLSRDLRGDLDGIILKALEKEPERRYASVRDLADDVRRHLRHEPVLARAPGVGYRLGKFVRRNRIVVGAVATIFVLLVAAVIVTSTQAFRARRAEAEARRQNEVALSVNEYLTSMLSQTNPDANPLGRSQTLENLLETATARLDSSFADEATVRASVQVTLADAWEALGFYDRALDLLGPAIQTYEEREAIPELLEALSLMVRTLIQAGKLDRAHEVSTHALEVARTRFPADDPHVVGALFSVARTTQRTAEPAKADSLYQVLLEAADAAGVEDHRRQTYLGEYASFLGEAGKMVRSVEILRECMEFAQTREGLDAPNTLRITSNYALGLARLQRFEEADSLYEGVIEVQRRVLGNEHPSLGASLVGLGSLLSNRGEHARAEPLLLEALRIFESAHEAGHRRIQQTTNDVGFLYQEMGDLERAEPYFRSALAMARDSSDPEIFVNMNNLASILRRQGELEEAERLFREARDLTIQRWGPDHFRVAQFTHNIAKTVTDQGRFSEGAAEYESAIASAARSLPPEHPSLFIMQSNYGECLLRGGRYPEAEETLAAAWEGLVSGLGEDHRRSRLAAGWMAEVCEATGRPEEARLWSARAGDNP